MYYKFIETLLLVHTDDECPLIKRLIPKIAELQPQLKINMRCLNSIDVAKVDPSRLKTFNVSPQEHSFAQTFVQECFSLGPSSKNTLD